MRSVSTDEPQCWVKYPEITEMKENKNNPEFKIRSTERNHNYICRISDRYAGLFLVLLIAGVVMRTVMHIIFDACVDSWKADPELNNLRDMWNILMYVIPLTLWALSSGFLVTGLLVYSYALLDRNIRIFLLKRLMRREHNLREVNNDASH
ncbi:TPA: F-type conjugal transfer protein TrbF [Escherichia coli]|nr:F-type conjugal transfer protein TrbF [Escherichia coli]HAM4817948.1 F-type conjugal transfer protein TrbF [Escherichia coli]HAM4822943.1 F-type conjugal transfer protein TrbF [Escherichia coli]HAM4841821.1 F-type conjugal transfer protein TrbF [Escherichia coli]HAM4860896.1 F-type conjugal transfer protein TrbF [Escherichia coli]